jgi:glycosyltransferase involved in cell wall biosynthesis
MSARLRVAFVHDSYPEYRRPLIGRLMERYDLRCFFLNQDPAGLPPGSVSLRAWRIPEMSDFIVAPSLEGAILSAHRREPFDVVLCPEPSFFSALAAGRVARRIRRPYVVFSGEWYPARHPRRALTGRLERKLVCGAACCVAYGSRVRNRLIERGVAPGRILISGNASPYAFTPADGKKLGRFRREWRIGEKPVVLFLGRLLSFKAPEVLIEAFAAVRRKMPCFLLIAGGGPLRDSLRRQVRRLGVDDALVTGRAVHGSREKDLLYSLASVFVLPSRAGRIAEPWGLVLNEAAGAGLPIVTTDAVGAEGDLIRDGDTGVVVKGGDVQALAGAIADLLRSTEKARTMAERARAQAAGFTVERMADVFGTAFERAAGGRQ